MKIFSIEEANALLPTVRGILRRIRRAHKHLLSYQTAAKQAANAAEQGGGGMADGVRYAVVLVELTTLMSEIESLGVQLKDFGRGLIDFPSLRDGRVVLLCWRADEGDRLEWWHDVEAGFGGGQPL